MSIVYRKEPFYYSRRRRRSRKRFYTLVVIILLIIALWQIKRINIFVRNDVSQLVSPLVEFVSHEKEEKRSLDQIVDQALVGTKGTYSVVIRDLSTGETYTRNPQQVYESASLYKLWIMATAYKQIEEGKLSEDTVLAADIADLNTTFGIASEEAELTDGDISLSVKNALQQMITISHNYAALLLSEKVKLSQVKVLLQEQGLDNSNVGIPPQTTAADIALFYDKLYKGQLANKENTQKMIALLKQQKLRNKLPKYLSNDVVIAHKTGELGWFSHDAGIVYVSDDHAYIIVVMTETSIPAAAEDRIATISKGVYNYFLNK